MKPVSLCLILACLCGGLPSFAQEAPPRAADSAASGQSSSAVDYRADLDVVKQAQSDVLTQARQVRDSERNPESRSALDSAIAEMERAQAALAAAARSQESLSSAVRSEEAAYQALLKLIPNEFRLQQSRGSSRGGNAGQPSPRELDQMEMTQEENRYETERQAQAQPTSQQAEQLRTADRLKQLAQRQQDLNDRLRELQTALQAARTEAERAELQRRLERLRDEERRMLSDMDELRQDLAQSPNAQSLGETRRQLDQTRTEMERAADAMRGDAASQALAAGSRAQQTMQNAREELRRQTSSRFTDQMRDLRNQARQLADRQEDIARDLDAQSNSGRKSLSDTQPRQDLAGRLAAQQSAFTNLLASMRAVTDQAETTEPLLSQQLYDSLRRADQAHLDNLLDTGAQLVDRGFLPQASQVEQTASENMKLLRQDIERAAESVLGNEADALRYAQQELDRLSSQVEREAAGLRTNGEAAAAASSVTGATNLARRFASASQTGTNVSRSGPAESGDRGSNSTPDAGRAPGAAQSDQNGEQPSTPSSTTEQAGQAGTEQALSADANAGSRSAANRTGNATAPASGREPLGVDSLRELARRLGRENYGAGGFVTGPIMGNDFVNWSDSMRDVEQVLDSADLRDLLARVRERVAGMRAEYRQSGRRPDGNVVREQILVPMTQVRVWLKEELARVENSRSLVPLDRDPVPDQYSEQVRQYYEKLGSTK